jgi:triosephosphate isomerase
VSFFFEKEALHRAISFADLYAAQIAKALKGISKEQMKHVTIAYEPVWAIGTGLVCDAKIAQKVHSEVRAFIEEIYDSEVANNIRIQYGGSVTP